MRQITLLLVVVIAAKALVSSASMLERNTQPDAQSKHISARLNPSLSWPLVLWLDCQSFYTYKYQPHTIFCPLPSVAARNNLFILDHGSNE